MFSSTQPYLIQGLHEDRRVDLPRHAQVVTQIAWPDEQYVDAVDSRNFFRVGHSPPRLDLHYSENLVVRSLQRARVEPEATCSVVCCNTPVTARRIAKVRDCGPHLVDRLEPGQHHSRCAGIKDSTSSDP